MLFETVPIQLHFLPDDVRIEDVVRRTRHAAQVFLTSAALGWTRTKLRSWLIVEYGMATEWTREDEVAPWLHPVARMDDAGVSGVVEDARMRITSMVVAARNWHAPSLAAEMIERGLVTSVADASGREAYAPAARVDLSFVERVASLFIADFLAHPHDSAHVTSCDCCGEIQLNGRIRHARSCEGSSTVRAPAESGVCLREGAVSSARARAAYVSPPRTGT